MRNKIFLLTVISLLSFMPAGAQSWTKKAAKSVFTLKTFDDKGTLLGSTGGFYVGTDGEGVSNFEPFRGASRAIIIDAQGKEWPVEYILGANGTYDVAKFRVAARKTTPLPIATAAAAEGTTLWLLPYLNTKDCPSGSVRKAETFMGDYQYYTIALPSSADVVGCPLLNAGGEVVGLMQASAVAGDTLSYAVSARYADSLRITGLSLGDATLQSTKIKKDLPASPDQALLMLYVASGSTDSTAYATLVDDFIRKFPQEPDGYFYRAQLHTQAFRFNDADNDMAQALKVTKKPDETHYNYSALIYNKVIYLADHPYEPWTLDKALDEAREAERLNPLDAYRHQQAIILYAQKKYQDAYDVYASLFQGQLRSADLFFEASRCREQLKDSAGVLALLDSCVATFSRPYLKEAAPYLLVRAQARRESGRFREAMADLNDYEQLMAATVNDQFYYLRHQVAVGARQYQQALNDIDRAITMQPQSDLYYSEKASLQVRVGLYDEAMETARQCIGVAPDHSDGYLFLGLAQCLKGNKKEGVLNLTKAKELGDPQADELIEKYGK
jgi:tetratricopeptide (TPR) repeat protein